MAPAQLSASKLELLTQQVVYEHTIVTYRVAARMFKVSARDAKAILQAFHEQSEGRTHATYVISGYVDVQPTSNGHRHRNGMQVDGDAAASSQIDRGNDSDGAEEGQPLSQGYVTELKTIKEPPVREMMCTMLVPEDELQAQEPRFTRITSKAVYSVEPNKLPDLVLLSTANAPVLNDPTLAAVDPNIIGIIQNSRKVVKKAGKASSSSTAAAKSSTSTLKASTSGSKPELKRKASASNIGDQAIPDKDEKASSKASGAATTSKAADKAKAAPAQPAANHGESSADSPVSSGKGKGKSSEAQKPAPTKTKSSAPAKSKAVASIDEDEYDALLADDDELMAEMDGLDASSKQAASRNPTPKKNASASTASEKTATPKGKVLKSGKRKTRKVTKRVTEVNSKGFKVTKEVETEEEYTASEGGSQGEDDGPNVAATAKPATAKGAKEGSSGKSASPAGSSSSAAAAKKKAATSKPGEQSSLKNFFGKPKATGKK